MLRPVNNGSTDPDRLIERALVDSAQIPPSVARDGVLTQWSIGAERGTYLPPFGTRARELALRNLYRMDEMNLIRGVFTGLAKTIAALPWEIKGSKDEDPAYGEMASRQGWRLRHSTGVEYYQEVFRQANFGGGWGEFVSQMVLDYLRYDAGGYVEVIAAGDSYDKPLGPITGIAHLDPLKCYPTGDPLYPAVYYDRWGGLHVLHHSRVIRLTDMNDGDELRPGYGDSALSRSISIAMQELWMQRYITARLDDQPPPGVTVVHSIVKAEWELMMQKYQQRLYADAPPVFGKRLFVHTMDPQYPPKFENIDFQSAPEKFSYREYTDIDVDRLANTVGVDRQEIMQLSGGNALGTEGQSKILAQKGKGKTLGYLLQEFERQLNDLLPEDFTMEFKKRDSQQSMADAEEAQAWADVSVSIGTALSPNEQRTFLADVIPSVQDAINNAPRVNDVFNRPVVAEDNTFGAAPTIQATSDQPRVNINEDIEAKSIVRKSYSDTLYAFTNDIRDLLMSASTPNPYLDRRAFTVTMRSFLKNYGLQAYKDGMASGGVTVDILDPDDQIDYMTVFMDQSQYINGLADDVYKTKTVTLANAQMRADMWGKSLQAFQNNGLEAANGNAMYMWVYGATEHCKDCLRLNGQVHRIHNWKKSGFMPKGSKLDCKGYNCLCQLVRTTERARGGF